MNQYHKIVLSVFRFPKLTVSLIGVVGGLTSKGAPLSPRWNWGCEERNTSGASGSKVGFVILVRYDVVLGFRLRPSPPPPPSDEQELRVRMRSSSVMVTLTPSEVSPWGTLSWRRMSASAVEEPETGGHSGAAEISSSICS